ncbi:hypothetical protein OROMI_016293 [Orobanche minor]
MFGGPKFIVFGAWLQSIKSSPICISEIQALVDVKAEESKKKPDYFGVFCLTYDLKVPLLKFPEKRELTVFNLLLKYLKEPSAVESSIDILLPCLAKKRLNFETCVNILQIIDRVAKVLRELNATSAMEMGALDYDKILSAYEKVNVIFFCTIEKDHALPILGHAVNDMSSEEMILRQSAFRLLLSFVEFSSEILSGSLEADQIWSRASIQPIVNNFLLKHMGNAMSKEGDGRKFWVDLLREMVLKLPKEANLDSYRALCSDDAEQDFFSNITHRRVRALSCFINIVSSGNLSKVVTYEVFVPLLFSMLFDAQDGKDDHIRSACINSPSSISCCMKWNEYYALLAKCFRYVTLKPDKEKLLLRVIYAILDHFHFEESLLNHEATVSTSGAPDPYGTDMNSSSTLVRITDCGELIQQSLHKNIFPKIQKLLVYDSGKISVNIILAALKLLKLLPSDIMDSQLPTVVHRISIFLKNRLESVRDEARAALSACLKELRFEYLQFIIHVHLHELFDKAQCLRVHFIIFLFSNIFVIIAFKKKIEQRHPQIHHELDMDGRPIYIKLVSNEVRRRVWNKL